MMILELARRKPVLMVIEDVHWIDPTTFEFLVQVLDRIAQTRVLMLLTSRPDNQPALGGHPNLTRLTLNRLSRGATEAIIASLWITNRCPRPLSAKLHQEPMAYLCSLRNSQRQCWNWGLAEGEVVPASLHDSLDGSTGPGARREGGGPSGLVHWAGICL